MQKIRLDPEACLAAAGAAHNEHIFVPSCLGVLGSAVHREAFGLGQDNVVLELGAMYGSMSLTLPQRAEPYSLPWRYFLAFLPFR